MPWFRNWISKKTEFSQYSDDFYLDQNGVLRKKDILKDDQAVIDSYFDTRLENILDAYSDVIAGMNGYHVEFSDEIVDANNKKRALDQILEADEVLANYKASDPELSSLSRSQLISKLRKSYDDAVANIRAAQNITESEVSSNENAQETVKKSES